ncbi:inverse autotransporter beta domain-containing protein [Thorsellia anophelis]|uniref:Invasin beta-domain of outer membrane n=1 Tax=Thorsellia anophelis DSM 18579 TaxID=1123402 RepID=A0A1I0DTW9_9GAMM|nr:inverse autotransporter beta domain-containing protein [Thorsellia anophelis]SET35758.1 Invasin beta-domain of outer membrane [Thorsellia anophelis DSM 18579]
MKLKIKSTHHLIAKIGLCTIFYIPMTYSFDGTTQIRVGNEKNIELLIPLKQGDNYTTFTQAGVTNDAYYLGFGHRAEAENYLFGLNSFLITNDDHNQQLSIGFEASNETYNFKANQYFGLDSWRLNGDYLGKTADGFDMGFTARPAKIPSLLGRVTYSKFEEQTERFRLGIGYQPIPLLSFNMDYDIEQDDVNGYIQLTYRFGEKLSEQLDPENLPKYQSLKSQRLDLAQFDTSLHQRKKMQTKTPPTLEVPFRRLELSSTKSDALVGEINTLEVKVFKVKDGIIYLIDDVVIKFKNEEMVLGVATSNQGLARLDFSSQTPGIFQIYSQLDDLISNTVEIEFNPLIQDNIKPLPPVIESSPPPEENAVIPPDETIQTPPEETVVMPPDETDQTPPDETAIMPPDETDQTPPDETAVMPPDETVQTPPDETVVMPPDETDQTPPDETVVTPPEDNKEDLIPETNPNCQSAGGPMNSPSVSSQKSLNGDPPSIQNLYLHGKFGTGEIITVNYTFSPGSGDNAAFKRNFSPYEFAPKGLAYDLIDPFTSTRHPNQVNGFNTFTLPPLTAEQAGQIMEVAMLPIDGFFRVGYEVVMQTNFLPCQ